MTARLKGLASLAGIVIGLSACGGAGTSALNQNESSPQGITPAVVPAAAAASSSTASQISSMMLSAPEPRLDIGVGTSHRLITSPIINDSGACNLCAIIEGTNTANGYGMEGVTSGGGAGVYGIAANTSPIFTTGVYGAGVGTGAEGVYGIAKGSGYGVYGVSVAGTGVAGISSNPTGYGGAFTNTTSTGLGVNVITTGGTALKATSTTATTIEAYGSGTALYGQSSGGISVYGNSFGTGAAVYASGGSGDALYADATAGVALRGFNSNGNGADITGSYIGAILRAPSGTNTYPLVLTDNSGSNLFYVDGNGNVFYHGSLNTFIAGQRNRMTAYTPNVASPTIEDTGSAQLSGGSVTVRLDSTFAQAIDGSRPYQVMLTPTGDTRGLYVASKSGTEFVVREVQGGRSSIGFDYHIYAPTVGRANQRMALLSSSAGPRVTPVVRPASEKKLHVP